MTLANPSIDAIAQELLQYLNSPDGDAARNAISAGTLDRSVGVNKATWRRWLDEGVPMISNDVRAAALRTLDALHEGGVGGHGDAHITRADLVAAAACDDDKASRVQLFAATMVWGSGTTNGRGPRYLHAALCDRRLHDTLGWTRGLVATGDLVGAYKNFRLNGIGRSFFTKWFWSSSLNNTSNDERPLILDDRVIETANQLGWFFKPTGRNWATRYSEYVQTSHELAAHLTKAGVPASGEHVESLLFERGPRSLSACLKRGQ